MMARIIPTLIGKFDPKSRRLPASSSEKLRVGAHPEYLADGNGVTNLCVWSDTECNHEEAIDVMRGRICIAGSPVCFEPFS